MTRRAAAAALLALLLRPGPAAAAEPAAQRSGLLDLSPALAAMQRDDTQNPALLWLAEGRRLWADGPRPCAGCHGGDPAQAMRGVAVRYPAWDAATRRPLTLGQRIDQCRVRHQGLPPAAADDEPRLALEVLVGHASRGLPMRPDGDARLAEHRARGERLFRTRFGQLGLSCAMCHEQLAGRRLAGSTIPQGHPTGYPIYRLEWQGVGSLQRRLRGCLTGVRAEPFAADAIEWTEIELFLVQRAAGMALETPAVRP